MSTSIQKTPWPHFKRSIVAILRGIRPEETLAVVGALIEEGLEAIEIPLNSPDAFTSIKLACDAYGDKALIGAGTVLNTDAVDRLHAAGGRLLVSPNVVPSVLQRAASYGMVTMPGVYTATEAFLALDSGASALKFFPADALGLKGIAGIRVVLPSDTVVGAVGGVSHENIGEYAAVGVSSFGLGSSLYKTGDDAETVRRKARLTIEAYDKVFAIGN